MLLEAICNEITDGNPDAHFLREAITAIKKLQTVAQLWTWQSAMGKGPFSDDVKMSMSKQETKRRK